jgi:hypothetical protein
MPGKPHEPLSKRYKYIWLNRLPPFRQCSEEEKKRIYRKMRGKEILQYCTRAEKGIFFRAIVLALGGCVVIAAALFVWESYISYWLSFLFAGLGGIAVTLPGVWMLSHLISPVRRLIEHEAPHVSGKWCAECGYDLRQIPSTACPECGTPRGAINHADLKY